MSECSVDTDCNGTLVCYNDVAWLTDQGVDSKCSCPGWNGYTGEDCLELGPGSLYLAVNEILFLFLAALGVVWAVRIFQLKRRADGKLKFSPMVVTTIYIFLAFFIMTITRAATIYKVFTPQYFTLLVTDNLIPRQKEHQLRFYLNTGAFLMIVFFILALLNISMSWIETASRVTTLSNRKTRQLKVYRNVIIGTEVIFVLLSPIGLFSTAIFFIFLSVIGLFIAFTYVYGVSNLIPMMKSLSGDGGDMFGDVRRRIKRTCVLLLLSMAGYMIAVVGYSIYTFVPKGGWRGVSPDEAISPALIFLELILVFAVSGGYTILWFLWTSTKTRSRSSSVHKTSVVNLSSHYIQPSVAERKHSKL